MIDRFIQQVSQVHRSGKATEHSYRPALQELLNGFDPEIRAINEPKRTTCGAPDFIVERKGVPIGYVEAKDLGVDLRPKRGSNAAQQKR